MVNSSINASIDQLLVIWGKLLKSIVKILLSYVANKLLSVTFLVKYPMDFKI